MLNVHPTICHWILDFLLHRSQSVRVNGSISSPVIISTGAPQGCVLSPFLFTLFTNDCVSGDQSVRLIKFSDDATLIGCIEIADETAYREEVQRMVDWCGKCGIVDIVSYVTSRSSRLVINTGHQSCSSTRHSSYRPGTAESCTCSCCIHG